MYYADRGDYFAARQAFLRALSIVPGHPTTRRMLVHVMDIIDNAPAEKTSASR